MTSSDLPQARGNFGTQFLNLVVVRSHLQSAPRLKISFCQRPPSCHDVNALNVLMVEPGAFYVMDRGYLDFSRLHTLHQAGAYFVIRARKDLRFVRYVSQLIDPDSGLCSDHIGRLQGFYSRKAF
ncbi:MAG: transposase, partial [Verrucomicrobia bacterium]|nr:transposase [Verrucomicrobiota bacterium]